MVIPPGFPSADRRRLQIPQRGFSLTAAAARLTRQAGVTDSLYMEGQPEKVDFFSTFIVISPYIKTIITTYL
jgi:hypothetical protein